MKNLHHIKLVDVDSIANKAKFSLTGRHRAKISISCKKTTAFYEQGTNELRSLMSPPIYDSEVTLGLNVPSDF